MTQPLLSNRCVKLVSAWQNAIGYVAGVLGRTRKYCGQKTQKKNNEGLKLLGAKYVNYGHVY